MSIASTRAFVSDDICRRIPPLYSQQRNPDPTVFARFYSPKSGRTWYVTEGSPDGDDYRFFGYVGHRFLEWSYFSLSDLLSESDEFEIPWDKDFAPSLLSIVVCPQA